MIPETPTREESKDIVLRFCHRSMELGEMYEITQFGYQGATEVWVLAEVTWQHERREISGFVVTLPIRPKMKFTFVVIKRDGYVTHNYESHSVRSFEGEYTRISLFEREWHALQESGRVEFLGMTHFA